MPVPVAVTVVVTALPVVPDGHVAVAAWVEDWVEVKVVGGTTHTSALFA